MSQDTCPVCLDHLSSEDEYTMDGCGHKFHPGCIIGWMRRGNLSCPTCRTDLRIAEESIPRMWIRERAKFLRKTFGRRRSAPPVLKSLISDVQKSERSLSEVKTRIKKHARENRDVLRQMSCLNRKKHSAWMKLRDKERLLGLFQCPELTLPSLVIQTFN